MGGVNLQATLAAANPPRELSLGPHHPITCTGPLTFDELGRLGCDHAQVDADDYRTRGCVDQSIAMLLIELLEERENGCSSLPKPKTSASMQD